MGKSKEVEEQQHGIQTKQKPKAKLRKKRKASKISNLSPLRIRYKNTQTIWNAIDALQGRATNPNERIEQIKPYPT